MNQNILKPIILFLFLFPIIIGIFQGYGKSIKNDELTITKEEKQVSFTNKNHALDNKDNFSPDGKFLCYDTRGTVYNTNLANCKSIEKIEISTGEETILWESEWATGEEAASGVAAVSWHPSKNKVIFILVLLF